MLKNVQKRILIVEDSPTQALQIKMILEREGYQTLIANDDLQGLIKTHKHKPDLIIADINMPIMNGYEMCQKIKQEKVIKEIPIILLTALKDPLAIIHGLQVGVDYYLTKPVDEEMLLTKLDMIFSSLEEQSVREKAESISVFYSGKKHTITTTKRRMLNLLMSTYENASIQYQKLNETQAILADLNEKLEEKVEERTRELADEVKKHKLTEASLSEAQRIAHIGSWDLDLITNTLSWSDEVYRMFGLEPQQFGATYEAFLGNIHPDDRAMVNKAYTESVKNKTPYNIVHRLLLKNGTEKYVNERCVTFYDDEKPIRSIGTVHDITERKQVEVALLESKEYANSLIHSSLDMIIAVDNNRKITEFNKAAEKTFGYQKEEVIGKNVNLLYANNKVGLNVHKQTVLNGHHVQEIKNKRKNGEVFPTLLSASVLKDSEGNQVGVMGVSRDFSEWKEAEQVLRESENKFRTLFEDSRDAIYLTSKEGDFLDINDAAVELFGYSRDEMLKLKTEELYVDQKDRRAFQEEIRKAGFVRDYELRLKKQDGTVMDCLETASVRGDSAGRMIGYQGIIRDITERKKARLELEKALKKAQEGERVKSLFLANMSHEIRTPLNAILGFTDLIEQSAKNRVGVEEQGFFNTIHHSGKRLLHTIHEVLDMAQIEAGSFSTTLKKLNLVKLTQKVTAILLPQAEDKGLKLSFTSDLPQGLIKGDEYCVTQALTNIVDNAIKYTDKGRIDIALNDKNGQLILSIKDTGIGISEEYLDEIFEVFTQESIGYTKKFQGVGLGLSLTRRYLELCNATIDIETEKEIGTTFTLIFQKVEKVRAKKAGEPKTEIPVIPAPEKEKKPLILLVEDDLSSQKLFSFFLKKQYDSYVAVSVEEAKQVLKSEPAELILLDLSLIGDEDGLDLARYLRQTKRWKETPIIAATAHAFEQDRDKCLAAGCNDYLAKPIKQIDLLEKINQYV